jgi:hypothetical protein
MEFETPVKNGDKTFIKLQFTDPLIAKYTIKESGTHTTPEDTPEFKSYLNSIAVAFQDYSAKWFPRPVQPIAFIKRLSNEWNTRPHEPYMGKLPSLIAEQTWRPEQIKVHSHSYELTWTLVSSNFMPHPVSGQDDYAIPYIQKDTILKIEPSPRSRSKHMLRKLRLQVAIAKWKMDVLTDAYYKRYGAQEDISSSSALSSELNSDAE